MYDYYLSSPMREGVLCWYPFECDVKILDLSGGVLSDLLRRRGNVSTSGENFDYIVLLDPCDFSVEALANLRSMLNSRGRLLLAYENPYAMRFWAGKGAKNTGSPYDSLFGRGNNPLPSKAELASRLSLAGFDGLKWYYPLTDHWLTQEVYSEDYLPNEFLNQRFQPYISDDLSLQYDERPLYREIIRNGAFEFMCGAYLVEARVNANDSTCPVDYVALTANREPPKRFMTIVRNDGIAVKTPLHEEGRESAGRILCNHEELARMGVNVIPMRLEGDSLVMPHIDLPTLWDYWAEKLTYGIFDEDEMFSQFDKIREAIYKASANGKCYWELVPANCFYDENNGELIFFDQEYCSDNISPDVALARALWSLKYSPIFKADPKRDYWLSAMKKRYDIAEKWEEYSVAANGLTDEVFGDSFEQLNKESRRAQAHIREQTTFRNWYIRFLPVVKKIAEKGLINPAIYGYGKRGKTLHRVLEDCGYTIEVIIDIKLEKYRTVDDAPKVYDVLIVSVLGGESIADELRSKVDVPVYTLGELIDEPTK